MPHFENIDQYESARSRKGKKKIIPIAPHSMQAVDYRPVKRERTAAEEREPKPEFEEVQIEPTSVKQMEREFRQAARTEGRRNPRKRKNRKGLLERLKAFLAGLLGKPAKKQPKGRRKRPRGQRNAARGQGAPKGESGQQQGGKQGSRNRSRGGRSRNRQGGGPKGGSPKGGGQRGGPRGGQKGGGQKSSGDPQGKPKAAQEGAGSGKSRRRRPRRSGNRPPQQKGPGQNPSANKD